MTTTHVTTERASWRLTSWQRSERVPGLAAAIVLGDELVWAGASGLADIATARPAGRRGVDLALVLDDEDCDRHRGSRAGGAR